MKLCPCHCSVRLRLRLRLCCMALLCGMMVSPTVLAWDAEKMLSVARSRGPEALAGAQALQGLLTRSAHLNEKDKVRHVNEFFNRRILFQEDALVWGVEDYWAAPLELMEKGRGDCEDYAIAKYVSLMALGLPVSTLRLVYVQARIGPANGPQQAHLVLAYYENASSDPLILDNLVMALRPATQRPDLTPVFSFNAQGLWQGVGLQAAGDPVARLSRWRDVLNKVRGEGFQ
jgi:predicted transglutaminase-like cysteine proteinase